MGIEYRIGTAAPAAKADKLTGMAAPFNSTTMIGKAPFGFRETIKPTAWNNTIRNDDQVLLDNHDSSRPLARVSAGTMEVHAGRRGAMWEATPNDTSYAQDVVKNVRANNYGGCSFSFEVVSDTWDYETEDDIPLRTLNEINVREISVVTFPAYSDTTVSMRDVESAGLDAFIAWYQRERWNDGDFPLETKGEVRSASFYLRSYGGTLDGAVLSDASKRVTSAAKKLGIKLDADGKNSELIVVEARDGITIQFDSETWNEQLREEYMNELKWIQLPSESSEGQPSSLNKEETAALKERARNAWRQRHNERKALVEGKD